MSHYIIDKDCESQTVVKGHIERKIKSFDGNLMLVDVDFKDHAIGSEHVHPEEQISYCVEGVFNYTIGNEVYRLEKGDSIFVPSNLLHGCKLISTTGKLLDIFSPCRKDFIPK